MKRCLALLLAAVVVLCATAAFAAQWTEIYSDEDYTVSISDLKDQGDSFQVTEKWFYKHSQLREEIKKVTGQPAASDITIKCYKKSKPEYTIIQCTYFDKDGKPLLVTPKDTEVKKLSPGMLGEYMWQQMNLMLKKKK